MGYELDTSGCDRELFEQVLMGINDSCERTRIILLWRGFLVRRENNAIFLCTGSAKGDLEMLQDFGFPVRPIQNHPDNSAEILDPGAIDDEVLFRLFNHSRWPRLGGPFGIDVNFDQDWDTFQRRKFGAKLPVGLLDPGIALLVKVLPVLGLHVIDACDGHLAHAPWIRFLSEYHLSWARLVLPMFTADGGFKHQWRFRCEEWNSRRWDFPYEIGMWHLGAEGCGDSLQKRIELYGRTQGLAVNIMESSRSSRLRKAKQRLPSPERLERAAYLRDRRRLRNP